MRGVKGNGYSLQWVNFQIYFIQKIKRQVTQIIVLYKIVDFIPGGSVSDKIFNNPPAPQTTKIILAEIVIALEKLHRVNIVHGDLCFSNILVDSDGHLTLTDFGVSQLHSDNSATKKDWSDLSDMTCHLFPNPIHDDNERSVMKMLADLTDAQLFSK